MKRILILMLFVLTPAGLNAAYYDTGYLKGLLDRCGSLADTFDASAENFVAVKDCGLSTGYILGVVDASGIINDRALCFPDEVRSETLIAAVSQWIAGHPEQLRASADGTVLRAVRERWSCGGS